MPLFLLDTVLYTLIVVSVIVSLVILFAILYFVPVGLWITALFSGVRISIFQLIGMRLRRVKPSIIVDELIKAEKGELSDVTFNKLETHYLAKGNINRVIDALISAKNAHIPLSFDDAAAIDLAGRNVLQAVKDSVNTKVIKSPPVEAVAKDGVQVIVMASVTVRAVLEKLVGGAAEETVLARVGQGIVAAIGSADSHEMILANPNIISNQIGIQELTAGTAFEVLSIDIADVDIGKSIGAMLKADEAEAELKVARAKAEEKRAEAAAEEQYFRARVQEMRAKLIEAEAQVPMAMAKALQSGSLGIMDYHRIQNIEADTRMRRSFADLEDDEPPEPRDFEDDNEERRE